MKPILFNQPTVKALLDGRKTVTRRPIKYSTNTGKTFEEAFGEHLDIVVACAQYQKGDVLWVRETWGIGIQACGGFAYRADGKDFRAEGEKWRPSIHMPREAARLFLKVTDVRVERVQEITEQGALAEGIFLYSPDFIPTYHFDKDDCKTPGCGWNTAKECFMWGLWDRIYGGGNLEWDKNPWVWVFEFERCEGEK